MRKPLKFGSRFMSGGAFHLGRPAAGYSWSREIAEQAATLIDAATAVSVAGAGLSTDAAFFGGALPTAATDIIVPDGAKLTIVAGDAFAFNRMFVYGELEVLGGAGGAVTSITCDTIVVWPGAVMTCYEPDGDRVDFIFRTEADIDIQGDPWQVSRGIISLGDVKIHGRPRQYILPLSNDVLAGVTTQLDFTVTPFLGKNGPAGTGEFDYTKWTLDWAAGERIVLPAMRPRVNHLDPLQSEIVEIASFNLVENATMFSAKDTNGSSATLTAAPVYDHKSYHDPVALADITPSFGPDAGAQTEGSHGFFFGRPFALNPNRNIRFLMSDTAAPARRRAYIGVHSAATEIAWTEARGLGRTDARIDSVVPAAGAIAADSNLRYRHAFMVYDAGWTKYADVERGVNCARLVGNAVWGGETGAAVDNIGAGSNGSAIAQFRSSAYYEANISDNTIGPLINILGVADTYMIRHNAASCVWGYRTNVDVMTLFKDLHQYSTNDTGREGSAYFSVSRTGHWIRNFAFGYVNAGRTLLARSHTHQDDFPALYLPDGVEQVKYSQSANAPGDDEHPRVVIQGDYFWAGWYGRAISKNDNEQGHGWRSHVKDCVYGECNGETIILDEYTGNYHIDRGIILGPETPRADQRGYTIGQTTVGFVVVGLYVANVDIGVWAKKGGATDPAGTYTDEFAAMRFIDFPPMRNVATPFASPITIDGLTPDVITLNGDFSGDFGMNVTAVQQNAGDITYIGEVVDPLGSYPLIFTSPLTDNAGLRVLSSKWAAAASVHGVHTNTGAGAPYFTWYKLVAVNRLVNEDVIEVLFPLPLNDLPDPSWDGYWFHPSSGAPYVLKDLGPADYGAALAAANAAANNGVVFA